MNCALCGMAYECVAQISISSKGPQAAIASKMMDIQFVSSTKRQNINSGLVSGNLQARKKACSCRASPPHTTHPATLPSPCNVALTLHFQGVCVVTLHPLLEIDALRQTCYVWELFRPP